MGETACTVTGRLLRASKLGITGIALLKQLKQYMYVQLARLASSATASPEYEPQ